MIATTAADVKDAVISILRERIGEAKKIDRKELVGRVKGKIGENVSDRRVRIAIEELRFTEYGARICSTTRDGGGYYFAASQDELNRYLSQEEHRIKELARRVQRQRKAAGFERSAQSSTQQPHLF